MYACVGDCALAGGQCTRHVDHSALVDSSDVKASEGNEEASRNIGDDGLIIDSANHDSRCHHPPAPMRCMVPEKQ